MGKKGDLSDFESSMVVGARRAGLSISEIADLLGFLFQVFQRLVRKRGNIQFVDSEFELIVRPQ